MVKRDNQTLELLNWQPPEIITRYDDTTVRTATLRARLARAVSESLKASDKSRHDIAVAMTEWLGEDVTENMLNAYSSEGREAHTISYLRLLALIHVTDDARLLQLGAEMFGRSVIDDKYLPWVEVGQLADQKENIDKAFDYARRSARKGARS